MLPSDEIQELILQRRKTRRIKNKQQNQLIKQRQGSLNGFRIIQNYFNFYFNIIMPTIFNVSELTDDDLILLNEKYQEKLTRYQLMMNETRQLKGLKKQERRCLSIWEFYFLFLLLLMETIKQFKPKFVS